LGRELGDYMTVKFISIKEGGKTTYRILEDTKKPINNLIEEVVAMEMIRGNYKTNKSEALRNAVIAYHAILKKEFKND